MNKPKVIILGGRRGLIGEALSYVWSKDPELEVIIHDKKNFDVLDFNTLASYLMDISPDLVVNAVSFNLVEEAEKQSEKAYILNEELPRKLSSILKEKNSYLIHFSTHMVFDGRKPVPYREEDKPNPLSVYGKSKFKGEQAIVKSHLKKWLIIRTSWPFGPWGANYISDFIDLVMQKDKICACHNKIASPTYTIDLATYSLLLVKKGAVGIFHVANSGQASLCEIVQEVTSLLGRNCSVEPILEKEENIRTPDYGVLDTTKFMEFTGKKPRSWMLALRDYIFSFNQEKVCV